MAQVGPPQARNAIRKALWSVLDRRPRKSEVDALWVFFESKCAYCGTQLDRSKREGHIDHLLAAASRGSNHISNCVLACGRCNGDNKREMAWELFLRSINKNDDDFALRRDRIMNWVSLRRGLAPSYDSSLVDFVDAEVCMAIEAFDEALARIRDRIGDRS